MDDDERSGGTRIAVDDTRRGTLTTQIQKPRPGELRNLYKNSRRFIYASVSIPSMFIPMLLCLWRVGKTDVGFNFKKRYTPKSLALQAGNFGTSHASRWLDTDTARRKKAKSLRASEG